MGNNSNAQATRTSEAIGSNSGLSGASGPPAEAPTIDYTARGGYSTTMEDISPDTAQATAEQEEAQTETPQFSNSGDPEAMRIADIQNDEEREKAIQDYVKKFKDTSN